jgi:hypothetical protein
MKFPLKAVLAFATLAILALSLAGILAAQDQPNKIIPKYTVINYAGTDVAAYKALAAEGKAIPTWNGSFTYNGIKYPFTMIGTDPARGSATTTVPFVIIPLAIRFSDGTLLDPTKPIQTACGGKSTALALTENSPLFQDVNWKSGTSDVGTTQYMDAFQRATFWKTVKNKAPNYHLLLGKPTVAKTVTVSVPANYGVTMTGSCGKWGDVDINWYSNEVSKVLSQMKIGMNEFPYILTYDTFEYQGNPQQCCVLGFHGIGPNGGPYGTGAYTEQEIFGPPRHNFSDIVTISHEIGEAIDDPFLNNSVPNWMSPFAPQYGCNNGLEVGDPVAGLPVGPYTVNGAKHQYYVQDLAFETWFAKAKTSTSVNGWYSMFGTFKTPAPGC